MVICRGIPGSGKSTKAKQIFNDHPSPLKAVCSTDDFRCYGDGVYKFNAKENAYMHGRNQELVSSLAKLNYDLVIVDNTHTTWREMRNVVLIGILNGYHITVIESETPWAWDVDQCTKRNTHAVPRDAIQMMKDRYVSTDTIREKIRLMQEIYENRLPCVPDGA